MILPYFKHFSKILQSAKKPYTTRRKRHLLETVGSVMPCDGRRSIWIARISTPAIRPLIKIVERRKTVDRQTKQDHRFFDGLVWFLTTGNRFSHHNFFKLGLRISSINFSLKVVAVKSQLSPHKKVFGPPPLSLDILSFLCYNNRRNNLRNLLSLRGRNHTDEVYS